MATWWTRAALILAAAGLIPACGSQGDTFTLNVLPVPTTGTILYVGPLNVLINVSPGQANVILSAIGLKSLQPAENILAIDYQPSTGDLYGLGSTQRLYRIDPQTGECSVVGPLIVPMPGTDFGMDVDPVANRIRVVGEANENLSLDPLGGSVVNETAVAYAGGDPNLGANPNIVACAHSNNVAGALTTTLYGIDSALDILVIQSPVALGTLNTVGSLGVNASNAAGFDITAANLAYAALEVAGVTGLYSINLTTGAASFIQVLGTGGPIRGFTLVP